MADVNPIIIKKTQDLLGKYVKKPALSEKLLKKPPFRFIHDVINVIIKETGYLADTFTVDELNYETIQDKDGKINFLQKLIDAVKKSIGGGDNIKVRPSKIVAGQEPERTNELLQAIGRAVDRKFAGDVGDNKKDEPKKNAEKIDQQKKSSVGGKTSKPTVNKTNKPIKPSDDNKIIKPSTNKTPSASTIKKNADQQKISKEKERSTNRSAIKSKDVKENGKKSATSARMLSTTTSTTVESVSNGKIDEEPSPKVLSKNEEKSAINEIISTNDSQTLMAEKSNEIDSIFGREENLNDDGQLLHNGKSDELTNGIDENNQLENHIDQITYQLPKPISAVTKNSSASAFKNEIKHSNISNSASAELVDIIDQEAELRRREKLEKSAEKRQHQKSSKSRENIEISPTELSEPVPPVAQTDEVHQHNGETSKPASSKPSSEKQHRSSSKRKSRASDEQIQPSVTSSPVLQPPPPPPPEEKEEPKVIETVPKKPPPVLTRARSSLRPPSVRPASARPGAPRRRDRNIEIVLKPEESLQMAGINVKVEPFRADLLDDEGDNLIIIEDPMMISDPAVVGTSSSPAVAGSTNGDGIAGILGIKSTDINGGGGDSLINDTVDDTSKGHLVQQILETQKEFSKNDQDLENKMDWDATTIRQQQSSAKQMDTLRESIQKLSRSINPLGKLMDFLQEDIDSMQMELKMWQTVYTNTKADLKHEAGLTENAVQPLKQQLVDIDANILEHIEMTNTCRLNILQNEDKILKLLSEI